MILALEAFLHGHMNKVELSSSDEETAIRGSVIGTAPGLTGYET